MFTDFLSAFQIHHDLNMCVSSTFFIVGRHIFKSRSPVYVCFESRCLNISNTLKQDTVGQVLPCWEWPGGDAWPCRVKRLQSSCSPNLIPLRTAVHLNYITNLSSCLKEKKGKGKGTAIPLQAWTDPEGSRRLRIPDFKTFGTWRW
jgi:hypothetical protein